MYYITTTASTTTAVRNILCNTKVIMLYNSKNSWSQLGFLFASLIKKWGVLYYMSSYGAKRKLSRKHLLQTLDNFFNTVFCMLKPGSHTLKSYRVTGLSWFVTCITNQEMGCTVVHVLIWRKIDDFMKCFLQTRL